jgi:large subunit ribosomal protein L25
MSDSNSIVAEVRKDVGKGASRRLRHDGKVPAVIYGGDKDPVALTLDHAELLHASEQEAFFSSILEIKAGKKKQQAVVRDMHRHPYKPIIMHIDFMRVSAKEAIRISVPVHFVGEEESPAGKTSGVVIQHLMTEIEISALPKDLPEHIEVDLSEMEGGGAVMLSEVKLPKGVEIPVLLQEGDDADATVANAIYISEDQGTGAAAAAEAEAAAADEFGEAGAPAIEGEDEEAADGDAEVDADEGKSED